MLVGGNAAEKTSPSPSFSPSLSYFYYYFPFPFFFSFSFYFYFFFYFFFCINWYRLDATGIDLMRLVQLVSDFSVAKWSGMG